jgi:hypothetical protein
MSRAKERKAAAARHRQKIQRQASKERRQSYVEAHIKRLDEQQRKAQEAENEFVNESSFEALFRIFQNCQTL